MFDLISLTMLDESPISLVALIVSKQDTLSYNFWTSTQAMERLVFFHLQFLIAALSVIWKVNIWFPCILVDSLYSSQKTYLGYLYAAKYC